ncbi:MAG: DUF3175 domain-containing protein [Acidobacteriaceae bacterium]
MTTRKSAAHKTARKSAAKKAGAANKSSSARSRGARKARPQRRWVRTVTTDSTHPPKDLFTKRASVIARSLASKKVSPKGPGSGMRMLTYFINRAGKGLSASRRKELERAKELLHERIEKDR